MFFNYLIIESGTSVLKKRKENISFKPSKNLKIMLSTRFNPHLEGGKCRLSPLSGWQFHYLSISYLYIPMWFRSKLAGAVAPSRALLDPHLSEINE